MRINQALQSCSHNLHPRSPTATLNSPAPPAHSLHLPLPPGRPSKTSTECEDTGHPLLCFRRGDCPERPGVCVVPAMAMCFPVCRNWKLGRKDSMGDFSQLARQDYEALKERCLRDGCLFEDKSFPAALSSIGSGPLLQKLPSHLQWRRPPVRGLRTPRTQCAPRPSSQGSGLTHCH